MLVPAILYKNEIENMMKLYSYSDEMMLYSGYLGSSIPCISENADGSMYHYAIIDEKNNNKLIGFFTYNIDWYVSSVNCFGLFSFDKNNRIIGLDVRRELNKIINEYHIHRMEWRMIGDNPVERHYDKFCKKYNGKKFILTDTVKDKYGKYHNDVIYEIIFDKN